MTAILAFAHEEHFIQTQGGDGTDAVLVVDQGLAVTKEGVVNAVSVTTELASDLLHAASVLAGDPSPEPAPRTRDIPPRPVGIRRER